MDENTRYEIRNCPSQCRGVITIAVRLRVDKFKLKFKIKLKRSFVLGFGI